MTTKIKEKNRLNGSSETGTVMEVRTPRLDLRILKVKIVGDSPLIVHAFSAKSKKMMLDKMMGAAKQGRAPKDPVNEFREALYVTSDGKPGFKACCVKLCMVDVANHVELKKTDMMRSFYVKPDEGELIVIESDPLKEPVTEQDKIYGKDIKKEHAMGASMREDAVTVGMSGTDLRYRPQFINWKMDLTIQYNSSVITPEQLVNLLNTAGFGCGLGDWRVQKGGDFGRFHVE